jgi:6-phosphogluconolactonase
LDGGPPLGVTILSLMKITRRFVALLVVLSAPLILFSSAQTTEKAAAKSQYLAYVGTYTTKTNSKGIYVYRFDAATGRLSAVGIAAETPDPSWVAVHANGKFLYAVNEAGKNSMVSAFALDAKTGKLTLLNQLPALGEDPCYLSFDRTGEYLFVANYTSGNVVVFPIGADGKLGSATANVHNDGKLGPNKERQDGPHAHWIEPYVNNGWVYVADLGLDGVFIYYFDVAKGTLAVPPTPGPKHPFAQNALALSPGTGPRHVAISRSKKVFTQFIYVLGELDSTVTVFANSIEGFFSPFQKVSTLPAGFSGRNDAAEIALHPNGKFLYTSNRGEDTIAIFSIDPAKGTLTFVARVSTGGKEPRHFAIDPTGKFLLAENQLSNNIVVFKIDPATGGLIPTGQVVDVPSPVYIAFHPIE